MDPKKKNLILGVVAVLLLVMAILIGFRDSLFGGGSATSKEVIQAIEQSQKEAEPAPPPPAAPTFTKSPKKVGG